jgi:pilus assembly protein FimV
MQKLLAMKSQSMSDAQKNAEATKSATNVAPETKLEEKPATATADVPKTEGVVSPVANESVVADNASAVNPPTETPAVVVPPPVVKNPATPSQAKPAPVEEEPSFLSGLMNSLDLAVLGGIGGVALLGAGWMFLRNKRRKDLDSFERGILTSGGLRANTVFGNTTGNASTSDTSFLTDFAQSADGSMIDTNDVDPIAEAEVYMAYGRDAQAEEILKDAISKEPKRYELHLKLLEMYAARKDTSAFEAIAGELYTTLGADDPVWIKVAEIGVTMEPENPLYDVSKSNVSAALAAGAQIGSAPKTSAADSLDGDDLDFSFDNDVDADLPSAVNTGSGLELPSFSATQNNVEQEISFDMDSLDDKVADLDVIPATSENNDSDNMLNFTTESDADPKPVMTESVSDESMDFDLGEFKAGSIDEESNPIFGDVASIDAFVAPAIDLAPTIDSLDANEKADSQTLDFDMDFTDFSSQLTDESTTTDPTQDVETPVALSSSADDMTFDFDLGSVTTIEVAPIQEELASSEISFDLPSFDLATDSDALPNEKIKDKFLLDEELPGEELNGEKIGDISLASEEASDFEVNSFDLSTINLDLNETTPEFTLPEAVSIPSFEVNEPEAALAESPDVDIKLDLVAAYIDMDDKEGARELLEEVIKEGGMQQQMRAQQLLASLT